MKLRRILVAALIAIFALAAASAIALLVMERGLKRLGSAAIEPVRLELLPDGSYTGRCTVLPIDVQTRVTLEAGRIASIELIRHVNGQGSAAEAVIPLVLETQRLDLDAVAGATYSSKAILLSIRDALARAVASAADGR